MKMETRSNLLTSLATKLTTFPGAVSPKAVLFRRNAYHKETEKINHSATECSLLQSKACIKIRKANIVFEIFELALPFYKQRNKQRP